MSMLYCCALQQVSPDRERPKLVWFRCISETARPFEILSPDGVDPDSLRMLAKTTDKVREISLGALGLRQVEVILQWIQRLITWLA